MQWRRLTPSLGFVRQSAVMFSENSVSAVRALGNLFRGVDLFGRRRLLLVTDVVCCRNNCLSQNPEDRVMLGTLAGTVALMF